MKVNWIRVSAFREVRVCRRFMFARLMPILLLLLMLTNSFAKPKPKPKEADPADPATDMELPDNPNVASLRVSAMDTIYELDLSIAQLNAMHEMSTGASESASRSPATVTPQFTTVLKDFQTALLEAKNDQQIAKLRNQVMDLVDSPEIHLDNDVVTTARSRGKAAEVLAQLKSSQIAAYLAIHAEEVSDPQELMMSTADGLQEMRAEANEKSPDKAADKSGEKLTEKSGEESGNIENTIQETSLTVGYLVAGMDDTKAHAVTQQVAAWLASSAKLSDAESATRRQVMEESAGRIVGNIGPIQVLNNWMQDQIATLLSNPQLPQAIDEILKHRTQGG